MTLLRLLFAAIALFLLVSAGMTDDVPADARIPRGLPAAPQRLESPFKIELGRVLFSETKLSADGTLSCASCHDPQKNFATNDARAIGIRKQVHRRNAPALMNRLYGTAMFWDGRKKTLEEQALMPITDAGEMGSTIEKAIASIADD
jgi:cytochrome c peroxidase